MGKATAASFALLAGLMASCAACTAPRPAPGHPPARASRAPVAGAATAPPAAGTTPATPPVKASPPGHRRETRRPAPAAPAPAPVPYGVTCQPWALRLGLGERLSQATQQETLLFTLTNISAAGCDLDGYPGVTLLNAGGRPMPFDIRWGSTDQILTRAGPVLVPLAPGSTAYFATSKWSCVLHSYSAGRYLQVIPPGDYQALPALRLRYHGLDYCRSGDPGHTVGVSPVEHTAQGIYNQRLFG